ncbi:hypothetical protein HZS_5358 [Henneguya salminicola]|nr:hypothetical protein HZS_5358 [Henneguya salminicola]
MNGRKEAALLSIINTKVLPGKIVITKFFRMYSKVNNYNIYQTISPSIKFRGPVTEFTSNTIEVSRNTLQNLLDDPLVEIKGGRKHSTDLPKGII